MMSQKKKKGIKFKENSMGFTIVELMIATLVFSMVLMICSLAIVHIGRVYYKGMIMNRTQDTARKVVDDISNTIQYGSDESVTYITGGSFNGVPTDSMCIGRSRFSYTTKRSLGDNIDQSKHVLWKDKENDGSCTPRDITNESPSGSDGDEIFKGGELLGSNMRVPLLEIKDPSTSDSGMWDINITVSYGSDGDFEDGSNYSICKGPNAGGQFCAVSTYKTSVQKRL